MTKITGAAGVRKTVSISNSWRARLMSRLRSFGWKRNLLGLVALVGTLGTFTAALDGVIDRSLDGCRKFGICDPIPPPVLVGTLSEVRVGAAHLTLREAYDERAVPTPTPTISTEAAAWPEGDWPGRLITYRVEFQGLEKVTCLVRWTLYDATTGERSPNRTNGWQSIHVPAFPDGEWIVQAHETDVNVGLIWVPYVRAGTFFIEIELLNASKIHLDLERSEPFVVAAEDIPTT